MVSADGVPANFIYVDRSQASIIYFKKRISPGFPKLFSIGYVSESIGHPGCFLTILSPLCILYGLISMAK